MILLFDVNDLPRKGMACTVFLLLVLLFLGASVSVHAGETSPATPGDTGGDGSPEVAIRVENETVPMTIIRKQIEVLLKKAKRKARRKGKDLDPEKARERLEDQLRGRFLSRLILDEYSKRAGVRVSDTAIRKQLKVRRKMAGGKQAFIEKLKKRNQTLAQFKKSLHAKLRREKFVRQEIGEVTVTDTDLRKVYRDNIKRLRRFSKARAYRLLRPRIRKAKENRLSKKLIARLRKKSDIEINF